MAEIANRLRVATDYPPDHPQAPSDEWAAMGWTMKIIVDATIDAVAALEDRLLAIEHRLGGGPG